MGGFKHLDGVRGLLVVPLEFGVCTVFVPLADCLFNAVILSSKVVFQFCGCCVLCLLTAGYAQTAVLRFPLQAQLGSYSGQSWRAGNWAS